MKRAILLCVAALTLCSGCVLLEDDFWEDEYDSVYDSPSGDDEDCDC